MSIKSEAIADKERYQTHLDKLAQIGMGYRAFKAVMTAVELDIFPWIDRTNGHPDAISEKAGVQIRQLKVLLDSLAALGFIHKENGHFQNTDFSRDLLSPNGVCSIANNIRYQEFLSQAYADMADTMRRGQPKQGLGELLSQRPEFVKNYIRGMAEISKQPARALAAALDLSDVEHMLDVGGGPGIYTLSLLDGNPRTQADILDLPETLQYTSEFVQSSRHADRIKFLPGDYHTADFGEGLYDLILISHVTHDEGRRENAALIGKAISALRPGGRLVIHDFMTSSDGTSPLFSALFSLHLVTYTSSGQTYSEDDYRLWLTSAGVRHLKRLNLGSEVSGTVVLIATKGRENEND